MPRLSVIVPMFNRQAFIDRCLDSVLRQATPDVEVIVVDDASTDQSVEMVRRRVDSRVQLHRHPVNRGVMAARWTGAHHATGEWLMYLDSDDELAPDALVGVLAHLDALAPDIRAAMFACRMDNGQVSPDPLVDAAVNYEGYLRLLESHFDRPQEVLNCARRSREFSQLTSNTPGLEDLLLLDFYRSFKSRYFPMVARLYHQDAANQIVKMVTRDPHGQKAFTLERIATIEELLLRHGAALRRVAPREYWRYNNRLAVLLFSSGKRRQALRYSWEGLRMRPLNARSWAVPIFGIIGHRAVRGARSAMQRWRTADRLNT
jgi:glycosyltransferase involved in cell wall biosynthesis